jgi:membrane protein implicated in regulation of membrane protease activity
MASRLADTLFALFHLILLAAVVVYAGVLLARGDTTRGALIFAVLAVYYILVLHKPVTREIARKKALKKK